MVIQNKSVSWKSFRVTTQGGLSMIPEYYGGGVVCRPSQVSRCDSKEFQGGVACVGASPWGLPHPRKARLFQEWPWVSSE